MAEIGGMRVIASLPSGAPGETLVCSKPVPGGSYLPVLVRRVAHAGAPPSSERAMVELQRAAMVVHHNVVQVVDVVADGAGVAGVYSAYPGITLAVLLREAAITATPIPGPLAVFLVSEICKGLQAIHDSVDASGQSLNLIHGDLTPDSVWLAWEGDIRVMDLGLSAPNTTARIQEGNESRTWFMSPEAAAGSPCDRRADVYSAASILYRLVTGRPPYSAGSPAETLRLIVESPVPDARALAPMLPPALGEMLGTGLAKNPAERFQTAAALGSTLQRFLDLARLSASPADLAAFLSRLLPESHPLRTAWTAPMLQAFSGTLPVQGGSGDGSVPPGVGLRSGLIGVGADGASMPSASIPRTRSGTLLMTALTSGGGLGAPGLHATPGRTVTQPLGTALSIPSVVSLPQSQPAPVLENTTPGMAPPLAEADFLEETPTLPIPAVGGVDGQTSPGFPARVTPSGGTFPAPEILGERSQMSGDATTPGVPAYEPEADAPLANLELPPLELPTIPSTPVGLDLPVASISDSNPSALGLSPEGEPMIALPGASSGRSRPAPIPEPAEEQVTDADVSLVAPTSAESRLDLDGLFADTSAETVTSKPDPLGLIDTSDELLRPDQPLDFGQPNGGKNPTPAPGATRKPKGKGGLLAAASAVVLLGGGGAAAWYMLLGPGAGGGETEPVATPAASDASVAPAADSAGKLAEAVSAPIPSGGASSGQAAVAVAKGSSAEDSQPASAAEPPASGPAGPGTADSAEVVAAQPPDQDQPPPVPSGPTRRKAEKADRLPTGMGGVIVIAPDSSDVSINGRNIPTWVSGKPMALRPGKYRLKVVDAGTRGKLQERISVDLDEVIIYTLGASRDAPAKQEGERPAPKKGRRARGGATDEPPPPPPPPPP